MSSDHGKRADVSLVIPAFNEEARLGQTLGRILAFLRSQPDTYELIVVDDGSRDRTAELARAYAAAWDGIRVHRLPRNRGKGAAVRHGMLAAHGELVFFSDADLSVPIEALPTFLQSLENGGDVAIGSRQKRGAVIEVHQPLARELLGKAYSRLARGVLGTAVSDFTCGFKGFRGAVARDLFTRQRLAGWSFDAEILYLARRLGYRIVEIPVRWHNDGATTVRLPTDILTSLVGLLTIRPRDYLGRYRL
jgi:dolichyl-phosphate beta-glucosyltransferase